MTYRIGIIGGDGIGPEVVAEAVKCLDATGVTYERDRRSTSAGSATSVTASSSPDEDLEAIRKLDAVLLGAVGARRGPGRRDRRARASSSACASSSTST